MIEKIKSKKLLISIIIRANYKSKDIEFFTPNNYSQQLGYMNRKKNYIIQPHKHNIFIRKIKHTQEVLLIKKGKVRVDYYDNQKKYLESRILKKGDVVMLVTGGHGFEMIEDTEIIEIKQGPYADKDKTRFKPIDKKKLKIK